MKLTFGALLILCIWNESTPKSHQLNSRNRRNVSENEATTETPNNTSSSITSNSSFNYQLAYENLLKSTTPPPKPPLYEELVLPPYYDKTQLPSDETNESLAVHVSLFVSAMTKVDEKNEEITLDADFGLRWKDYKIYRYYQMLNWTDPRNGLPIANQTLNSEFLEKIWKPDIFIDELVDSSLFTNLSTLNVVFEPANATLFDGWDKGEFIYSARTPLKLSCYMDFTFYPADTQTCVFNFRSCGNYSTLEFTFKIRRNLSYHVAQTYAPSTLLIFITWLCFILPSDIVEARIGISMTTLLTLTAMFGSVRQQSPEVSYSMAIDVWMVFCIFFVFSALLLFSSMYWMKKRNNKLKKDGNEEGGDETITREPNKLYEVLIPLAKKFGFITFAVVFVLFSISYWALLFYCSDYFGWEPLPEFNAEFGEDGESNQYLYHGEAKEGSE